MGFSIQGKGARALAGLLAGAALTAGLAACGGGSNNNSNASAGPGPGAVFTETNATAGNDIVVFNRAANGDLSRAATYPTQGDGVGQGTLFSIAGTSNPVVLDADHSHLFAINAGSDTISEFAVDNDNKLTMIDRISSVGSLGSERPFSIALRGNLLYVLNAGVPGDSTATPPVTGVPGSITGFTVGADGTLTPLPNATEPLSPGANATQVQFSPDGKTLVVTDKSPQKAIITYAVDGDGVAGQPVVSTSEGNTAFGFDFTSTGFLVVSEAEVVPGSGPDPNGGTVTSYSINADSTVTPITSKLPANGTATCWTQITANDKYAYSTNTESGTIADDNVAADGGLTVIDNGNNGLTQVTPESETEPKVLDLDIVGNSYLYAADATSGTIYGFAIRGDGDLTPLDSNGTGLPESFVGVASY